jgi:hypothetical protein
MSSRSTAPLEQLLPGLTVPDRPPDINVPTSDYARLQMEDPHDSVLKVWHPTADSPGVDLCTPSIHHYLDAESDAEYGAEDLQWLGEQGMAPVLEKLGLKGYVWDDKNGQVFATAITYPPTERFCIASNELFEAEFGAGGSPIVLEPYTNQDEPEYSPAFLKPNLRAGIAPVATAPLQALHDQLHMLTLHGTMAEIKKLPNLDPVYSDFERALSLIALRGAVEHPYSTHERDYAVATWGSVLGVTEYAIVNDALQRIGDRVRSTEQRFAELGIAS